MPILNTTNLAKPFSGGTIGKLAISGVANDKSLSITGATHTGTDASSDLSISATWNTTGVPTAFKVLITDTAHGAGSLLVDVGTVANGSYFSVGADGATRIGNAAFNNSTLCLKLTNANGTISIGPGGNGELDINGTNQLWFGPSNSLIRFGAANNTDLVIQSIANDAGGYTQAKISAAATSSNGTLLSLLGSGFTVAAGANQLPAASSALKGSIAWVTDSNATITAGIGAIVATGGANIVPVFCDGTNWRIF